MWRGQLRMLSYRELFELLPNVIHHPMHVRACDTIEQQFSEICFYPLET